MKKLKKYSKGNHERVIPQNKREFEAELPRAIERKKEQFYSEKMGFAVNNTVENTGDGMAEIMVGATLGGQLIESGIYEIDDSVVNQSNIQVGTVTATLKDKTCDFTPDGDVNISARKLVPVPWDMETEVCTDKLYTLYGQERNRAIRQGQTPPEVDEFITTLFGLNIRNALTNAVINNDKQPTPTQFSARFDGLIPMTTKAITAAVAGQTPIDVSTPVVLTAANIKEEFNKIANTVPVEFFQNPNTGGQRRVWMLCSYQDLLLYRQAQSADANYTAILSSIIRNNGQSDPYFNFGQVIPEYQSQYHPLNPAITIVGIPQFEKDRVICTPERNLWLGMLDSAQYDNVDIIDLTVVGHDKVGFKSSGAIDQNCAYLKDIVHYGTIV